MTDAVVSAAEVMGPASVEEEARVGEGPVEGAGGGKHVGLFRVAGERREEVAGLLKHAAEGKGLDAAFVHDLRVGVRRLTEVAGLLTVLMDKTSARAVEESLRGLRKAAGELRDLDVTVEHLLKWKMPGALKRCAKELVERELGRRGELEGALRGVATSASVAGTMVLLARVLEEQGRPEVVAMAGMKLEKELEKRVGQRRKKLRRDFGRAAKKQRAEVLHEARISAKKLRYVVELQKELAGKGAKGVKMELAFLKDVQGLLGDHHDVHVIEETLETEVMGRRGERSVTGLGAAWRKWHREMEKKQAGRAAGFFMRTYVWMNGG